MKNKLILTQIINTIFYYYFLFNFILYQFWLNNKGCVQEY